MSGFLFILDQTLKHIALNNKEITKYIFDPWLGWELLKNPGIAFGIPIPNTLVLIATPILIAILIKTLLKKTNNIWQNIGVFLIITGALSNFIDRIRFEVTIDYFRILTSIINIADIMIVIGAAILIINDIFFNSKHNQGGICSPKSIPPLLSD